eukprot:gnl/MRDRNA2_/MRDRNA2_120900_c0_seq1.p1 gnl/MRDRNA2_/MRDRNA2_120900_c0~~gnl/MRDRNA2_/MRDRNA2_120900_c0_seq1.p1  ORF type:complete len:325 (+),score=21.41 gnl/MRDRNA2_/MRDRNA2_120900_c0_seq1:61-975(+)
MQALSGTEDSVLRLWSLETLELLKMFSYPTMSAKLCSLDIHWQSMQVLCIVSPTENEVLYWLWALKTEPSPSSFARQWCSQPRSCVSVDWPNMRALSISGQELALWDIAGKQFVRKYRGHTANVTAIFADWNNEQVLSGAADGCLKLWHTKTGECLCTIKAHDSAVQTLGMAEHETEVPFPNQLRAWKAIVEKDRGRLTNGHALRRTSSHQPRLETVQRRLPRTLPLMAPQSSCPRPIPLQLTQHSLLEWEKQLILQGKLPLRRVQSPASSVKQLSRSSSPHLMSQSRVVLQTSNCSTPLHLTR